MDKTRTDKTIIAKGFIFIFFILIFFSLLSGVVYAKPDFVAKTGKSCSFCHPDGPPVLGPAGEYFKEHQTLEGYVEEGGSKENIGGEVEEGETSGWMDRVNEWTDHKTEESIYYPCSRCHDKMETNTNVRTLKDAHITVDLKHGGGLFWCLDCHDANDRDTFILYNGKTAEFDNPARLCGKCHGPIYRDWEDGIHGKQTGLWNGEKNVFQCIKCHNPHDPGFKPIEPEAQPEKPGKSPAVDGLRILVALGIITFLGLVLFAARR